MTWTTALTVAALVLIFLAIFFAVTHTAGARDPTQADKDLLIMSIQTAADAMNTAAGSITNAAQSLTTAATALQGANDTSALDAPVAALGEAVTALNTAAAAITALVPPAE